jgi:hypothetical protein
MMVDARHDKNPIISISHTAPRSVLDPSVRLAKKCNRDSIDGLGARRWAKPVWHYSVAALRKGKCYENILLLVLIYGSILLLALFSAHALRHAEGTRFQQK